MGDTVNVYGLTSLTYRQYTFHHRPETLDTLLTSLALSSTNIRKCSTKKLVRQSQIVLGAIDSSDIV